MEPSGVWTAQRIRGAKGRERLACVTATDAAFARLLDEAGVPLILVGDSLAMTVLGHATTLPATMDVMVHHTAAVVRGTRRALVVADMPFLSFHGAPEHAVLNAGRFLQEGGAGAVKIEGGAFRAPTVERLVRNGIPVLGHIGLLPQQVRATGGYRVQGRTPAAAEALTEDARRLEAAGVFALILEGMPAVVAASITAEIGVPTIGIGAGPGCDGQIMVLHDLIGMTPDPAPRFVRRYAAVGDVIRGAASTFMRDVASGDYPSAAESYRPRPAE